MACRPRKQLLPDVSNPCPMSFAIARSQVWGRGRCGSWDLKDLVDDSAFPTPRDSLDTGGPD